MKVRNTVILAVIVLVIALLAVVVFQGVPVGVYDVEPVESIHLGLDLTGGVSIVYEAADPSVDDLDAKIEGAMKIFRSRLDSKGFTEATVTKQGISGIRVEVPINNTSEITNPEDVVSFLGTPALLQFIDPEGEVIIEGSDIKVAQAMVSDEGEYMVHFELSSEGADAFYKSTAANIGKQISIELDGQTISAATVNEAISNQGQITGNFTLEEAQNLAMQIESGALPIELDVLEQRTISSTLGDNALQKSILAGIIGLVLLLIFMAVVYRVPGLMADIALIAYIALVIFFISLFEVELTLPGIAGIILGIGMAVDANVVIFERFKEEVRLGKSIRASVKTGFSKAAGAIMDANVTTIIAAIVLAIFGTGSIKGFAYTLAISIVVSMFTALVVSQGLFKLIVGIFPNGKKMYVAEKKVKGGEEA